MVTALSAKVSFSTEPTVAYCSTRLNTQVSFFLLPRICNESQLRSVLVTQATVDHDRIYQGALELRGRLAHGGGWSL